MGVFLAPDLLDALRALDTCSVANAIETFQVRLRNEGFTNAAIRAQFPGSSPMLGQAVTVRIRTSSPPPVGEAYPDRTDWWRHLEAIPGPRVVVIEDIDVKPGFGAFIGEMHARILQALGCVGAVTNGSVRDLPAVERAGFHLFAGGVAVSHAYAHIVDFGRPVEIGGLRIFPGDLLMGDLHGVLSIPSDIAPRIPEAAAHLLQHEEEVLRLCNGTRLTAAQCKGLMEGVL